AYDIEKLHEFFLEHEEVEAHYYEKLKWLWEDGQECGPLVLHGWLYDIARYVAEHCGGTDEHGNPLVIEELEGFFDRLSGVPGYGKEVAYLGGGWSPSVPFKCEDACEEPMVELLVMDYWCNWGKAWV
ncbi:hypothetical protein, partial [Membranihabitans maritimus]|uniref:hypothetical protein n=1 Tax=Membranihabitans maritimus TaxID=2904244 RepID=UPI001F226A47